MEDIKFKEAVSALIKDKSQREALAQVIVEYVQVNHITQDFMNVLLDTRTLNPGDSLVKKVRTGMTVHTWVPGSNSLKSEVTVMDRINYVLDGAIISLLANEWELEAGQIGTVAELRSEALAYLRDFYMNKVFTALTGVWTAANSPLNFTDCAGPLTQTALEDMINHINQTTPGVKAIVGVRSALTPITKFGAFWGPGGGWPDLWANQDAMKEVMQTGWLGTYFGAPIVALNQVYNDPFNYTPLLPVDKVLVIGQKAGEFILYGPERSKEWVDMEPTPPYWHLDIYQQFGIMLSNAIGVGVLKVA
jgi:hypothetical protein